MKKTMKNLAAGSYIVRVVSRPDDLSPEHVTYLRCNYSDPLNPLGFPIICILDLTCKRF